MTQTQDNITKITEELLKHFPHVHHVEREPVKWYRGTDEILAPVSTSDDFIVSDIPYDRKVAPKHSAFLSVPRSDDDVDMEKLAKAIVGMKEEYKAEHTWR